MLISYWHVLGAGRKPEISEKTYWEIRGNWSQDHSRDSADCMHLLYLILYRLLYKVMWWIKECEWKPTVLFGHSITTLWGMLARWMWHIDDESVDWLPFWHLWNVLTCLTCFQPFGLFSFLRSTTAQIYRKSLMSNHKWAAYKNIFILNIQYY